MAVKWAVANGNWSAGATWNDGVVPTIDDDVELNGHTIYVAANIVAKTLKNENGGFISCNATTLSVAIGTVIQMSATTSIIKFELSGNPSNFVFSCNIEQQANKPVISVVARAGVYHSVLINGNITLQPYNYLYELTAGNIFFYLSINGNVTSVSDYAYLQGLAYNTQIPKLTINGLCQNVSPRVNVNTFDMNGRLDVAVEIVCTTFNINGSITYVSTTNSVGVKYTTLNILNPDTFTWKDVTEPRSNPFIIITNAEMNNRQQYPPEDEVKEGTEYVWGEKVGTYTPDYPPESVVLKDYEYGDSDDRKTGTMVQEVNVEVGCVTPEDVRKDVPLVGMGVVGSLVVPSVDDVREGVVFDNGSVGTLIVQGGGDRLRIADFGYYTDAQSDTYIVDLTEQDKPKFAVAEERVLIEMFPNLDLDNIPDKYFDDLFVKYLKYRLIVEYYRTAGINSTFTPSEPTTEIVNYQNVRNEVWLNSANIYLKAWGKKYPESITKPQRILL